MNDVISCLTERRSVRSFKSEQIKQSELEQIIKAGLYAPSGMGKQSAIMLIVQDAAVIKELSKLNAAVWGKADVDPFYGAPTVVAVLADSTSPNYVKDGSLVMGNLMNAAFSIGVDSCWINRAEQVFESDYGKKLLKDKGIADSYKGVGFCILGYRDTDLNAPHPRREGRVFSV